LVRAADVSKKSLCPDCGTELSREPWAAGLCPHCLVELALEGTSLEAELLADPREAPTLQFREDGFGEGEIQGDRYRIRSLLGRGGMGEVWRAYDLKLRLDVALKALRTELIQDARALETLRQEVRVARDVISPNVCRVFDLQELDGQELVSMEYIDGTTLLEILRKRSPLELEEAQEIASQFLAGLEAIHDAGLVHRDIKPENVMVTRTGRVVVMDFGIAKGLQEGERGVVAGTPAYMSPEQARGDELDARSDVFAAGVVLAEMVAPGGIRSFDERRRLWEGIHQETPRVPETPWSKVIAQAIPPQREERFASASALARALEEVTLRAVGDEEARPYPGLSAFEQEDARFFFGRELEIEALWKKLRRPHLNALIGPSGAGKSSFLRAGLLPALPEDWRAIVATPGNRPFDNLARALVPELGDTPDAADLLQRLEEPGIAVELLSEWRQAHERALVIVDQFEELFTQSPQQVQTSFAELLGRLPLEADVHVLLSMRDDFVMQCHRFEALRPIFSELTPLDPPLGSALRRALVQPALKCGYRFADESLVEAMLAEVEGERGALPMVAFTAARLWEERDRDTGLLTTEAYEQIGGVGGALAQHAEATLGRIGKDQIPIVRELFRNLVTAEGTRAARDRDELLSVFEPSETAGTEAGRILDTLIDARLLTSYELPPAEGEETTRHRIEIIHESLLTNWPRLVRWRMQDAEGAKLRDELRHQAQLWKGKDQPDDLLWTGTSYKEFELWRERYPGGLTAAEDEFARAMTDHAERRRRRRRALIGAILIIAIAVATAMGVLWQKSEMAREEAVAEARRAEASKLLALAQLRQEEDPTEALAYTTVSLELADTDEARVFALRLLLEAPPALEVEVGDMGGWHQWFSPDGSRLAATGSSDKVRVWTAEGGPPVVLPGQDQGECAPGSPLARWSSNELLVTGRRIDRKGVIWKLPEGERVGKIDFGACAWWQVGEGRLLAEVQGTDPASGHEIIRLRSWKLPDGEPEELGTVDLTALQSGGWLIGSRFDPSGRGWIYRKDGDYFYRPLPAQPGIPDRLVASYEGETYFADMDAYADPSGYPEPGRLWTQDTTTLELRLWDLSSSTGEPLRILTRPTGLEEGASVSPPVPTGRWIRSVARQARLWNLEAWPEARPITLRRSGSSFASTSTFHPSGDSLVVGTHGRTRLTFWPLRGVFPSVIDGYSNQYFRPLEFSPDSRWLATKWPDGTVRLWPVPGSGSREVTVLTLPADSDGQTWRDLVFDPHGRFLIVVGYTPSAYIVPLDGSPPRRLEGLAEPDGTFLSDMEVSPSGSQVATAVRSGVEGEGDRTLWVLNLETGEQRAYDMPEGSNPFPGAEWGVWDLTFADESTLYTSGAGGMRRWNLDTGTYELMLPTKPGSVLMSAAFGPGGQTVFVTEPMPGDDYLGPARVLDLATGEVRSISSFADSALRSPELFPRNAFDASGTVAATGDSEGIIRVAPLSGGEPHLLLGHEGTVTDVAISPDGRWIASAGEDNTLRLWPMPDLDQPPLHTLPHDELLAKLESLTNIRVVRDPESAEGWKVTLDPFPGWAEVPTW
jgi:serine/threonine protein kinase/WD40 repeat protein